jgi:hypothetical protein
VKEEFKSEGNSKQKQLSPEMLEKLNVAYYE